MAIDGPSRLRTIAVMFGFGAFGFAGACGEPELSEPVDRSVPVVVSMEMLPPERPLSFVGMSVRLRARRVAADGRHLGGSSTYPERFTWSSDAPDVVTVDQLGVVHAVSEGTARITATSEAVTGTARVTVREAIRAAWSFPLDGSDGGMAIGEDGTVYIAETSTLHALTPTGTARWAAPTGGRVNGAPAVAKDGTIYLGTSGTGASLIALARSGMVLWSRGDIGWVTTSPALAPDGTLYVASSEGTLHALHPDGRKKWEVQVDARFPSSPAVAEDGTVFIGDDDGRLHAIDKDGVTRWTFLTRGAIWSSPAIAPDGTIYFGSQDQNLYALDSEGRLRWTLPLPLTRDAASSPALGRDGTIYIGGDGLHAVTEGGQLAWTYSGIAPGAGTVVFLTPVVAGDGTIYAGGVSHLYALNADGTLKWDYAAEGNFLRAPAIGLDGTIFASSSGTPEGRALHAIVELEGVNGGFESAPWPKARGDRANTGRSGRR